MQGNSTVILAHPKVVDLILHDRCLAVFIDDTGHEALPLQHPVYGLAGCAAMARDLYRVIVLPWKEVRRQVNGSPDIPLHANEFARTANQDDMEAVAGFFRTQPFFRLGAIIRSKLKNMIYGV
jgi:hypothetical protein